METAKPHTPQ